MEARQIILDMQGHTSIAATKIVTGNGRTVKIPPLPSMKQLRETNSQFEKRLKLINKDSVKNNTNPGVKVGDRKTRNRPQQRNRSPGRQITGPLVKGSAAKMPAEQIDASKGQPKTVCNSSRAIARYYKAMEKRRQERKRTNAAFVICRHIYACVQSRRLSLLMHSIVSVQAVVRGFLVRCNFALLSDLLRQRNFMFRVARRKFKRWLNVTVSARRQRESVKTRKTDCSATGSGGENSEIIAKPIPAPPARALSPVGSRFSELTSAVANALGGNNRRSPKADIPLAPKTSTSPGADMGGLTNEQSFSADGGHDPFSRMSANTAKRSGSMHSTSTGVGTNV